MKKLIAKLLGLYTGEERIKWGLETGEEVARARREYYQKVLDELQRNGTLPPNCDLKLAKQSMKITNQETGEVIAEGGKWKRLPLDGEPVSAVITYTHE